MKTIGIEIDGVLRNYLDKFDAQYRKKFINDPSLVEMNDDFTIKESDKESEEELERMVEKLTVEKIVLPVNTSDLTNHYKFDSETIEFTVDEEFSYENMDKTISFDGLVSNQDAIEKSPQENLEDFMYEKYPFKIFGEADPYRRAVDTIHFLQFHGQKTGEFKVILLSTIKGKAIASTYYFLSHKVCRARNIAFVENHEDKWDYCDILVDVNTESFESKPDNKISIKIEGDMTKYCDSDYSIKSLSELKDEELLDKVLNCSIA